MPQVANGKSAVRADAIARAILALQDVADEAKKALSGAHGYGELAKKLATLEALESRWVMP